MNKYYVKAQMTLLPSLLQPIHSNAITQTKGQKCPSTSKKMTKSKTLAWKPRYHKSKKECMKKPKFYKLCKFTRGFGLTQTWVHKISKDSHGDQLDFKLRKKENGRGFLGATVIRQWFRFQAQEWINKQAPPYWQSKALHLSFKDEIHGENKKRIKWIGSYTLPSSRRRKDEE